MLRGFHLGGVTLRETLILGEFKNSSSSSSLLLDEDRVDVDDTDIAPRIGDLISCKNSRDMPRRVLLRISCTLLVELCAQSIGLKKHRTYVSSSAMHSIREVRRMPFCEIHL